MIDSATFTGKHSVKDFVDTIGSGAMLLGTHSLTGHLDLNPAPYVLMVCMGLNILTQCAVWCFRHDSGVAVRRCHLPCPRPKQIQGRRAQPSGRVRRAGSAERLVHAHALSYHALSYHACRQPDVAPSTSRTLRRPVHNHNTTLDLVRAPMCCMG